MSDDGMTDEQRARWIEDLKRTNKPTEIIECIAKFIQASRMVAVCEDTEQELHAIQEFGKAQEELAWAIRTHSFATFGEWMAYQHKGSIYTVGREGVGYTSADGEIYNDDEDEMNVIVFGFGEGHPHPPAGLKIFDLPDDPFYATN